MALEPISFTQQVGRENKRERASSTSTPAPFILLKRLHTYSTINKSKSNETIL